MISPAQYMKRQRRRTLLAAAAAAAASIVPPRSAAQPANRRARVGFISPASPGRRDEAFIAALRGLGYLEGRNLRLEMRFANGRPEALPGLIDEVLRLAVDVVVVGATIGAHAAKSATTTTPIVFAGASDPVAGGIVRNLARPEGNLTGFSLAIGEGFAAKWLELLKEVLPEASHFAALWSSSNASAARFVRELELGARNLGVQLEAFHATNITELDVALASISGSGARGLIVTPSPFAATQARKLVDFCAEKRLAAMYFDEQFAEAGGLMSYGPSIADAYRRAATYVDRILKGARPSDLPVQQPTRFELAINLKAARLLDIRIPQVVLLRADRVIE